MRKFKLRQKTLWDNNVKKYGTVLGDGRWKGVIKRYRHICHMLTAKVREFVKLSKFVDSLELCEYVQVYMLKWLNLE